MSDDKNECICPLCCGVFRPDGATAEEHLAEGIIQAFAEMQKVGKLNDYTICLRCGCDSMLSGVMRNAFSRHFDIYICPRCGNDEALRIHHNNILSTAQWWSVREVLGL